MQDYRFHRHLKQSLLPFPKFQQTLKMFGHCCILSLTWSYMEIIDFNVHFSDNGDWFGQECDGIEAFIKIMEKSQINKAVILPLKVNCSSHFVIECCRKFPDSFYGFGTISLDNYESEIDLILKNNLKGERNHGMRPPM